MTTRRGINLKRLKPVDFRDHEAVFRALQGNIVKGHGRDHAVNIFLEFKVGGPKLRRALRSLAEKHVTSAFTQLEEAERYRSFHLPGGTFGNLFLTPGTYRKLGLASRLERWFADRPVPESRLVKTGVPDRHARITTGVVRSRGHHRRQWAGARLSATKTIDALLLLADDSEQYLLRTAHDVATQLQEQRRGGRPRRRDRTCVAQR